MCECQVEQGNEFNPKIFQKNINASKNDYGSNGFDWDKTKENCNFWDEIVSIKNFDIFFEKYPKKGVEPVTMYIGQTYPLKDYTPSKETQEMLTKFFLECKMYNPNYLHINEEWLVKDTPQTTPELKVESFSARDVDFAYLAGVFNVSGIDGLHNEIKRLKEIGKEPHEIILTSSK